MIYRHIAKEIAECLDARGYTPPNMALLEQVIADRLKSVVDESDRFKFIEGVLARTIGFHGEKSEWVVDEFRLFGATFRNAIDNAMKQGQWGCGVTT